MKTKNPPYSKIKKQVEQKKRNNDLSGLLQTSLHCQHNNGEREGRTEAKLCFCSLKRCGYQIVPMYYKGKRCKINAKINHILII